MIFAHKLGNDFSQQEVEEMVNTLLEKGYFDQEKYRTDSVLTSEAIQRVWMEATNRRKRDLTKLPYLLIDVTVAEKPQKCKQKEDLNAHDVDIFPTQTQICEQHADIFRQSKVKQSKVEESKELPPSIPPRGTEEGKEEEFHLPPPPEYALNPRTHNYSGLLENLRRLNVTDVGEMKAIIRLSNYGEKGKPLWKLLMQTNWSKITAPGRYIIKLLKSSG